MSTSLIVKNHSGKIIFDSDGHWLHPLFDLSIFLSRNEFDKSKLFLNDKIAGVAAAALITEMGFKNVHIDLISKKALSFFQQNKIVPTFNSLVDKIECQTEMIIKDHWQLKQIVDFLRNRAGRELGKSLVIEDLDFSYGSKKILKNLSLSINEKENLIIEGENGSGKSTLLKLIAGLISSKQGSISIDNINITDMNHKKRSGFVSYSHQEHRGGDFPITALEVTLIGLSRFNLSKKDMLLRAEIAMKRCNSFHLRNRLWQELSGGEKQRISLARTLCQKAGVILLDEPSSFLDIESKEKLVDLIHTISNSEAPTMIVVSHDADFNKKLGWKRVLLEGGKIC